MSVSGDTPLPAAVLEFQRRLRALQDSLRSRGLLPRDGSDEARPVGPSAPDAAGLLVLTHDLRGHVTRANDAARLAFGYTTADIVGVEVRHLFAPEYLPRLAEHSADQIEHGAPFPFEICANGPEGALWLEVNPRIVARDGVFEAIEVVGRDISARRRAEEAARREALHDPLTGLPNRRLFMDRLEQAIIQAERSGARVAVLFLDLDRFKMVNDAFGHAFGDAMLRSVSELLTSTVRDTDTVSRRGGDEFTVLLPSIDGSDTAAALSRRVLDGLTRPITLEDHTVHVGASIGIAVYPSDGRTADALVHSADVAMYRAKAEGRGCARFFHEGMNGRARDAVDTENVLRAALRDGTIELEFQPRVSARSDRVVALEALLRVRDAAGETLPTARVVQVAEETGLIGPVGRWVIGKVCEILADLSTAADIPIVVNVSERECLYGELPSVVQRALDLTGVDADRLELDLSHGFAANEEVSARAVMAQLHDIGVRLGLDDFGTARTSLRTLRAPFLQSLTIAREYVAEVTADERVAAITLSMIELGHALDLDVVAVGVETEAQADWLKAAGCDVLQGQACGPPVPAAQLRGLFCS